MPVGKWVIGAFVSLAPVALVCPGVCDMVSGVVFVNTNAHSVPKKGRVVPGDCLSY